MQVTREHAQRLTLVEMREFVASSGRLSFTCAERKQIYGLVERTLQAHEYLRLPKKDKGVVRRYLAKIRNAHLSTPRTAVWIVLSHSKSEAQWR